MATSSIFQSIPGNVHRGPDSPRPAGPGQDTTYDVTSKPTTLDGAGSLAAARNGLLFSANACASPAERHTSITRAPFSSIPAIWLRRPSGAGVSPPAPLIVRAKPSRSKVSSHSNSTIVQNGMAPPRGSDGYLARAYGPPAAAAGDSPRHRLPHIDCTGLDERARGTAGGSMIRVLPRPGAE